MPRYSEEFKAKVVEKMMQPWKASPGMETLLPHRLTPADPKIPTPRYSR